MNNDFLPRHGKRQDKHLAETTSDAEVHEVAFKPPEDIAAEEDREGQPTDTPATPDDNHNDPAPQVHKPKRSLKERLNAITKKQWIIIAIVAVLVLGGGGVGAYFAWFHHTPKPVVHKAVATNKVSAPPVPVPIVSTLTGLPISDASINNLPVTAIMIENSIDARPQSGLNDAGVVFEAVAEGGITRFLTLWQDTAPTYVGPVRSVRPYYLQWLLGFDAPVAHVGGSADALSLIKTWNVKNLDQFYNPAPYWRISTRYAPHNMYTDVTKLHTLEAQKGYTKSNYTGFPRKAEQPAKVVTARSIDFTISGTYYNSHYDYDPTTNSYLRSEGGQPHIDANTNKQINPKVVIGLIMDQGQNGEYTTYNTLGSGKAYVFQDGIVTIGTWTKTDNQSQFIFKDQNGAELKLNAGRTWITVLGGDNRVAYKP
jgi:Protein of unknown function (DUF3048) N-terminal domain/Protein of unknown function (DUF3048) C-terminal domain